MSGARTFILRTWSSCQASIVMLRTKLESTSTRARPQACIHAPDVYAESPVHSCTLKTDEQCKAEGDPLRVNCRRGGVDFRVPNLKEDDVEAMESTCRAMTRMDSVCAGLAA